jgi:hypothetical protein
MPQMQRGITLKVNREAHLLKKPYPGESWSAKFKRSLGPTERSEEKIGLTP